MEGFVVYQHRRTIAVFIIAAMALPFLSSALSALTHMNTGQVALMLMLVLISLGIWMWVRATRGEPDDNY